MDHQELKDLSFGNIMIVEGDSFPLFSSCGGILIMKKIYIWFASLLVLGIAAGIFYLKVIHPGSLKLPDDVVMETAFDEQYDFGDTPDKARLIEFMYTSCPDVCPVTTLEMSKLKSSLEKEGVFGKDVEFITVTIDPTRDDQEVLQDYASRFQISSDDDGWHFLTGEEEDTKKLANSLEFRYDGDPGTGEIVHTSEVYFMDADNNLVDKFMMGESFDREKAFGRIMRTVNKKI